MSLIGPAHSIVNLLVSNRNRKFDFFESQFGRIGIESELLKSIREKFHSFPTFNLEKCRIHESFPEFLDLDNLFSFPGRVYINTSSYSCLAGSYQFKFLSIIKNFKKSEKSLVKNFPNSRKFLRVRIF